MPTFLRSKWVLGLIALVIIGGGYWFFVRSGSAPYQFITVTKGSINETVSATGNTTPMQSVSLAFQDAGTIARVNYQLGDQVSAGAVIAELNTASLSAAVEQAQANLAAAQATLTSLQAGTGAAQLALDQSAITQAQASLWNAIRTAYLSADDAVHNKADQLFTNPRTNPVLNFVSPDFTLANQVQQERLALEPVLTSWGSAISAGSFGTGDPTASVATAQSDLSQIETFLGDLNQVLQGTPPSSSMPETTLVADETLINTASTNVSSSLTALTSGQTALISAQGTLAVAEAGATPAAIAQQEAQIQAAQAAVLSAEANLQNTEIVAPISGVLTQQDAKVGQQASPGTPLVSIIGNNGFEVDAGVSDTDVGKLAIGDGATMTLDAFPNETFTGSVFYIAPAQTDTQGVISYLVKISFDTADPRLKSGLTANVDIQAKQDTNVLILPQYAILQNDNGTFVEIPLGKTTTTTPVTLGISDENGKVEVLSGVTEGEQVINIGLKATP